MPVESMVDGGFVDSKPDLPGAFPQTPEDEIGPRRNKLHKRNDPRGWAGSKQQAPRSHGHTDSGVGLEPGLENLQTHEHNVRADPATTRSHDQAQSHTPKVHENGINKPGIFTGAYSRIGENVNNSSTKHDTTTTGTHSGARTSTKNDVTTTTHTDASRMTSNSSMSNNEHVKIKGSDGPAMASSGSEREQPETRSEESQHNVVRNGRDRSDVDHSEQYWGDIPRGGGVYNTVVGAGSEEKAPEPREHSLHPSSLPKSSARDAVPTTSEGPLSRGVENRPGSGVHNGVIGSGSAEDKSSVKHQRAFPLVSPQQKTAAARDDKPVQNDKSLPSKFKENIFGTGAGATAGYAAHQSSSGQDEKPPVTSEPSQRTTDTATTHQKSSPYAQKYISDIPKPDQEETRKQPHHTRRDIVLVGAGPGVAGYGADEYASHEGNAGKRTTNQNYAAMYQTGNPYTQDDASSSAAQAARSDTNSTKNYGLAGVGRGVDSSAGRAVSTGYPSESNDNSHSGRNTALAGTGIVGAAAAGYGVRNNTDIAGQQEWHRRASSVSSAPGNSRRGSTVQMHAEKLRAKQDPDPSRGGTYNVLADGTPSGVNLETARRRSSAANPNAKAIANSNAGAGAHPPVRVAGSHHGQNHSDAKSGVAAGAAGASAALAANSMHARVDENGISPRSVSPVQAPRAGGPAELSIPVQGTGGYVSGEDVSPMSSPKLGRCKPSIPNTAGSKEDSVDSSGKNAYNHDGAKVAAAGVGVGAAGAAAHRAWTRHDDADDATGGGKKYKTLADGTPSGVRIEDFGVIPTSASRTGAGFGGVQSPKHTQQKPTGLRKPSLPQNTEPAVPESGHSDYETGISTAVAAGAGAVGAGAGVYTLDQHRNTASKAAAAEPTQTENASHRRSSSSQAPLQYKVLASGTPSGIDLSQSQHGSDGPSSTSPSAPASTTPSTALRRQSLGLGKKKTARFSDDDLPSSSNGAAMGAGAVAVAAGAVGGSAMGGSGPAQKKPIMHRCSNCGKEDDVSEYLSGRQ